MVVVLLIIQYKTWEMNLIMFLGSNQKSALFGGRQKPLDNWIDNNEIQALPILVFIQVIYNVCLIMGVVVLV